MVSEFADARVRLSIVTFSTSIDTAELGAKIFTLNVLLPLLLGTSEGFQPEEVLQLPVPPFQYEVVWASVFGPSRTRSRKRKAIGPVRTRIDRITEQEVTMREPPIYRLGSIGWMYYPPITRALHHPNIGGAV